MSKPYKSGSFIYPPRPEHRIRSTSLFKYEETNEYIAEPKLNGSNCEAYINEKSFYVKNRHNGPLTLFKLSDTEIQSLHRGKGEMVLNGEYMNKSQNDKNGKVFNHKFVIFDILVYNGEQLIGTTFEERYNLLLSLYNVKEYDEFLYQIDENIFMVKKFEKDFESLYNQVVKIDMYEGWVLKKKNGKLEQGVRQKNNCGTQIKCRKENKNYSF